MRTLLRLLHLVSDLALLAARLQQQPVDPLVELRRVAHTRRVARELDELLPLRRDEELAPIVEQLHLLAARVLQAGCRTSANAVARQN